jgi:hypothetical protein
VKLNKNISIYGEKLVESILFYSQKRHIEEMTLYFGCNISKSVESAIEFAIKNETISKLKIVNERFSYNPKWEYAELDLIFSSLAKNSTIQSFYLGSSLSSCMLNFQDQLGSWNFLYQNESLKELTFNSIHFEERDMFYFVEAMKGNRSIESLSLINSNFEGDFSFLESNKTIKSLNIMCKVLFL